MGESNGNSVRIAVQSERRLTGEALCAYLESLPDFQIGGRTATVEKLGTHNRSETLTIAYELGMVDPAR